MNSPIDLHIHTTASDGTDSPELLLEKLRAAGITTFAVTDHDTVDGARAMSALPLEGLRFYPGIEFSTVSPLGKCHILGYGCDFDAAAFVAALKEGARLRRVKLEKRLTMLREEYGIVLTDAEQAGLNAIRSPGKPHLADILIARGLAVDTKDAIRRFFVHESEESDRLPSETAIKAIRASGGVAVWAHPLGGEGEPRLTEAAFWAQLEALLSCGIRGLECCYSRYDAEERRSLLEAAAAHGLYVSGGSDYHGKKKPDIALGQLSAENAVISPEALTILQALDTVR